MWLQEFGEFANTFFGIGDLDPEDIFDEWLTHANLELGDYAGAMELPDASNQSSAILLISGGIAGAVSRTLTAPMDRCVMAFLAMYGVSVKGITHAIFVITK